MDSPFMDQISELLCTRGVSVWRFEFPYMQERRRTGSKRPPNRLPDLIECWREALDQVPITAPLFIGGKSMGGRIASLIANDAPIQGLICLSYPFHPAGKPEKLRIEHLHELTRPTLIVQGERDTLGNREEVPGYKLPGNIAVTWLTDGDHSFKPRKKSGATLEENMLTAAEAIDRFVSNQ